MTDAAVRDRSSPGYAGAAISFFRSAGRSSNVSVELPVVPLDDPGDDPLFVPAKSLTASRSVSGSTVSPVHADLIVTSWGVLGRPRPSFLADGQLSVPRDAPQVRNVFCAAVSADGVA